ncbi:MAG: hypothetical protein NTW48_10030 [Chloroflexi bacterium]|nr:hypothetical protein [Chloroflexota bacterium]
MTTERRVFKVFIGSPSDVTEERQYFHDVIAEYNNIYNITGRVVIPLEGKDALPGRERAQARINEDCIKCCDLAVFVLSTRWGNPSGKYSSGFEEEYELATDLSEENQGRPAIWLYFRDIPSEHITTPDEQLKKVLDFRSKIEREHMPSYHHYQTPMDWQGMFKRHLHLWISEHFGPREEKITVAGNAEKQPEAKPTPVPIAAIRSQWTIVDTPGSTLSLTKEVLNPNNQGAGINKIAITPDGTTMWAIVRRGDRNGIEQGGSQVLLYRSIDGGISWTDTQYLKLVAAQSHIENGTFIWDLAVAPDDPNIIIVACADISVSPANQEVWISTDKGDRWANTGWPPPNITAGADFISAMDISMGFGNRMVLIGTRDGSGLDTNNLQIMRVDQLSQWNIQDATSSISASINHFTGDILAAKFSPNFPNDHTIVIVYCDDTSAHKGTWLATGTHNIKNNSTVWQKHADHVEIRNTDNKLGDSPRVDEIIIASLELPLDFSGDDANHRRFYVSTDAIDRISHFTPNRGVYRVDNRVIYTLMDNTATFGVVNTNNITRRASSIAYFGTCTSGKLLVGEVLGYGNLATVSTWFTDSPNTYPIPCWYPALKPPTGAAGHITNLCAGYTSGYGNAKVAWSPTGIVAYAATSAAALGPSAIAAVAKGAIISAPSWPTGCVNVVPCDESAFSISRTNGETWNQLGLINTLIAKFTDVAPSADGRTLYLASVNANVGLPNFDSIWRSSCNPEVATPLPAQSVGTYWERILTHVTAPDCTGAQTKVALLRTVPYCADPSGEIIAWGVWDPLSTFAHGVAAWSPDYGDYWAIIIPRNPIQDFTFESRTILYFLSPTGSVQKMPYTGTGWSRTLHDVYTKLQGAHTIASYPEGKVLIGANVSYHSQFDGISFSNNFNTANPSFSILSIAGRTPFMGDMHVAFDPNFKDNNTIFACDNSILGGSIYRNNPASQVKWEDADIMATINGAIGLNGLHQVGHHGLILAFTGEALYSAHEISLRSTPPGNSGVCRSFNNGTNKLGPLSGIPKPGVTWDCFNTFRDIVTAGVTFSSQPTSLKSCGCCTLDTDTTLYAIDYRPYVPASKMGMLWACTDNTAKRIS